MQAVILAAGLGTRMGDLTQKTPKPLLRVGEKTLLEHKLQNLPREINEVVIVVGYLGDQIHAAFGSNFSGKPVIYVEQKELNGTGHALALCRPVIHGRFLVLMGDDLYAKKDLDEMMKYPSAVLVKKLDRDVPDGKVAAVRTDGTGRLLDITENMPAVAGTLENAAAYVLDESYFSYPLKPAAPGSREFGLPQTVSQMVLDGNEIFAVEATSWKRITSPEDLKGDF